MNAQNIISHRMFVAALNHDETENARPEGGGTASPAKSGRGRRAANAVAAESPVVVAQQLFLLSEFAEWQPG